MQLHLASNFPYQTFHTWELGAFKGERFRKGWRMKSMLVVAWLTAQPALDVRTIFLSTLKTTD